MEYWKKRGKEIFLSANGQRQVSRNRLACEIRRYFVETPPKPEDVQRWTSDGKSIETVRVVPPKINASNSAYIDWNYIADYVLLACSVMDEDFEAENQIRQDEYRSLYDSYVIRKSVHDARIAIRSNPKLDDDGLMEQLKKGNPKIALAHIKEARRLEKIDDRFKEPTAPEPSPPLEPYEPQYFPRPEGY